MIVLTREIGQVLTVGDYDIVFAGYGSREDSPVLLVIRRTEPRPDLAPAPPVPHNQEPAQ